MVTKPPFFSASDSPLELRGPYWAEHAKCRCTPPHTHTACSQGFAFSPPSQLQLCRGNRPLPPAHPLRPLRLLRPVNGEEGQGALMVPHSQGRGNSGWDARERGQHAAIAAQHPAGRAWASRACKLCRAATVYLAVQFISLTDSKQIHDCLGLII